MALGLRNQYKVHVNCICNTASKTNCWATDGALHHPARGYCLQLSVSTPPQIALRNITCSASNFAASL